MEFIMAEVGREQGVLWSAHYP